MAPSKLTDEKLIEHADLVLHELAFRELLEDELPKIPDGMIDFEAAERISPLAADACLHILGVHESQQVGVLDLKEMQEIKKQMDELDKPPALEEQAFREEVLKTEAQIKRDLEDERFEKFLDRFFWFLVLLIPSSAGVAIYFLLRVLEGK